jgi:hypothetical protein
MVYAPYGRIGISLLREYCRRLDIQPTELEVGDLVAVLRALPRHHPLVALLRGSRDSANADALADALLNPRERSYSVPQLFDFLGRNGLTLGRWYWQAPYLPQCGAITATPHAARLAALPEHEQWTAMELWRGTMPTHSAIAYPAGRSGEHRIRFDDERWRRYVPVRRPSTVCVKENAPAGAVAVLLNTSHAYTDLILPIDAEDLRLFTAIDGRRSIEEIAGHARGRQSWAHATAFFRKLWQYDQVVFDVSMSG